MAAHVSEDAKGVQVLSIRLDHFIDKYLQKDEHISLLKMDIEGAEEAVLTAAQGILNRVDAMVIEVYSAMYDELVVRDILKKEFAFVCDLSTLSAEYPVLFAYREAVYWFYTSETKISGSFYETIKVHEANARKDSQKG